MKTARFEKSVNRRKMEITQNQNISARERKHGNTSRMKESEEEKETHRGKPKNLILLD